MLVNFVRLSPHLRSISLMASGTAAVQVLAFLVTPIITRLDTPAAYGAVALFAAIAAAVAGGRFEHAVALPREDSAG